MYVLITPDPTQDDELCILLLHSKSAHALDELHKREHYCEINDSY